jgi:hypothetical protein
VKCSPVSVHLRIIHQNISVCLTNTNTLCRFEFDRVQTEDLAWRIWLELKNTHAGNVVIQAWLHATYRREYENFTHLPGESIDVVWTSLGPLSQWVPGPTTRWALGTTRHLMAWSTRTTEEKYSVRSTRLGSCTRPALYGRLLDVLD